MLMTAPDRPSASGRVASLKTVFGGQAADAIRSGADAPDEVRSTPITSPTATRPHSPRGRHRRFGSSAIPQIGQLAGASWPTCECIARPLDRAPGRAWHWVESHTARGTGTEPGRRPSGCMGLEHSALALLAFGRSDRSYAILLFYETRDTSSLERGRDADRARSGGMTT
jgi:hypothetical protein